MTALDERRKRALLLKFRHLDEMLTEVDRCMEGKRFSSTLSDRYTALHPEKKEELRRCIAHVQETMCRILTEKGISVEGILLVIVHSIDTSLTFMDMSAEEIRPRHMRGYGELSMEATDELNAIATELQKLFKQMRDILKKD